MNLNSMHVEDISISKDELKQLEEISSISQPQQQWYPNKSSIPNIDNETANKLQQISDKLDKISLSNESIWPDDIKYMTSNKWNSIPNDKREQCRRHKIHGVQVRQLPSDHFLAGEFGLFATQKFSRFDVLGEYTGKIVGCDVSGHYVAALEDKGNDESLGIDAQVCGSELRFINSYLNIAFKANVTMRTVYINTYPHIIIVCCDDIEVGDEFLLDYGEAYTKAFLTPHPKVSPIAHDIVRHVLPGYNSDSSRSSRVSSIGNEEDPIN